MPEDQCPTCGSALLGKNFCTVCGAPVIGDHPDERTFTREALNPLLAEAKRMSLAEDREEASADPVSESREPELIVVDFGLPPLPIASLAPAAELPPVQGHRAGTAREGLRGTLSRIGIRVPPGSAEQKHRAVQEHLAEDEGVIRRARWPRAVGILVANRKGGVGKTPTTLLLAGVLAAARRGSVCVLEVSDDPGALSFRAEGSPPLGMGELVRDIQQITSAEQLAAYTAPQTSRASVIGSIGSRDRLSRENVLDVTRVVDRFFAIRVMDSGSQYSSPAFRAAVETADALVIPVMNAADAILEAVSLLEELRASGDAAARLADRAVFVRLSDGRPEHPQIIERVGQVLTSERLGGVFDVPYDEHIAARGQLTLRALAPETRQAFCAMAAGVIRTLESVVR
jgi:MinD-like ATPase involved in chromosome partitioning or flagellar assembly